jgi:SAM-dependent methyltransferase
MKVRDSGMPERDYWESLFDLPLILDRLGVDGRINDAVEVGCGYGTFTLPVAQRISGTLHTFDIEPAMIAVTRERAKSAGVRNVNVAHRDVIAEGFGLARGTIDAVLLFNILHGEDPVTLLQASAELLTPMGALLALHWRSDIPTPRGPDLSIRPRAEDIVACASRTGVLIPDGPTQILPPWHFGVILRRSES